MPSLRRCLATVILEHPTSRPICTLLSVQSTPSQCNGAERGRLPVLPSFHGLQFTRWRERWRSASACLAQCTPSVAGWLQRWHNPAALCRAWYLCWPFKSKFLPSCGHPSVIFADCHPAAGFRVASGSSCRHGRLAPGGNPDPRRPLGHLVDGRQSRLARRWGSRGSHRVSASARLIAAPLEVCVPPPLQVDRAIEPASKRPAARARLEAVCHGSPWTWQPCGRRFLPRWFGWGDPEFKTVQPNRVSGASHNPPNLRVAARPIESLPVQRGSRRASAHSARLPRFGARPLPVLAALRLRVLGAVQALGRRCAAPVA